MDCSPPGTSVHGDSPVKNTGADCHTLLQGIFPTQGSNPGLPHCRQILYHLSHQGSPQSNDLVNVDNYCLLCSHPCSWNSLNSAYTWWFKYDPDWCYYEVVHCLSFSICLFPLSTEWTDNSDLHCTNSCFLYSVHKMFLNFEPVHCSMSSSVASWPVYMFLRKQVR